MSDTTPDPAMTRAAYLAAEASTTWESLMHEGPSVVDAFKTNFPDRAADLSERHFAWHRAGRPAAFARTGTPTTTPNPRPAPAPAQIEIPASETVTSMTDLAKHGVFAFNEFARVHPDRFNELRSAQIRNAQQRT